MRELLFCLGGDTARCVRAPSCFKGILDVDMEVVIITYRQGTHASSVLLGRKGGCSTPGLA